MWPKDNTVKWQQWKRIASRLQQRDQEPHKAKSVRANDTSKQRRHTPIPSFHEVVHLGWGKPILLIYTPCDAVCRCLVSKGMWTKMPSSLSQAVRYPLIQVQTWSILEHSVGPFVPIHLQYGNSEGRDRTSSLTEKLTELISNSIRQLRDLAFIYVDIVLDGHYIRKIKKVLETDLSWLAVSDVPGRAWAQAWAFIPKQ